MMNGHTVIAIVSYHSADDVVRCLAAVSASTERDFSVEICENGGPEAFDRLSTAIAAFTGQPAVSAPPSAGAVACMMGQLAGSQQIRLNLASGNLGYAGAVNICLDVRKDDAWDFLWILNPDARPTPGSLQHMKDHLIAGDYAMVGARLVLSYSNRIQLYGGRWRRLMARGYNIGLNQPMESEPDIAAVERQIDYVHGACMLVARDYVRNVGPMDDDYFLYCEEVDWCLKGRHSKKGYAHQAIVYHDHGTAIGSSVKRANRSRLAVYLDERNRLLLSRRNFPALYPFILPVTLLLTTQYLAEGAFRNFGHALSGWWAGARGEVGKPHWLADGQASS